MLGKRSDWLRWLVVLVGLVLAVRLTVGYLLPLLPEAFAWSSSLMLGAALTFFVVPLPQERVSGPEQRRPADRSRDD
jgi:hypothetical protein